MNYKALFISLLNLRFNFNGTLLQWYASGILFFYVSTIHLSLALDTFDFLFMLLMGF